MRRWQCHREQRMRLTAASAVLSAIESSLRVSFLQVHQFFRNHVDRADAVNGSHPNRDLRGRMMQTLGSTSTDDAKHDVSTDTSLGRPERVFLSSQMGNFRNNQSGFRQLLRGHTHRLDTFDFDLTTFCNKTRHVRRHLSPFPIISYGRI